MNAEIKTIKGSERVVVTSLDIAETFGKEHKQVLRDIREIKCSAEFGRHNFTPTSYIDQWNRTQPMYYVTRSWSRNGVIPKWTSSINSLKILQGKKR